MENNGHKKVPLTDIPVIGQRNVILKLEIDEAGNMAMQCHLPVKDICKLLQNVITELIFKQLPKTLME